MTGFDGGPGQFSTPAAQPASQAEISGSPLWHLFDYDLVDQTFTLIRIEERIYREASFLDHRIDAYKLPMVRYEMQHMDQVFPKPGPARGRMGWIFHIGHCGSTLLSRALAATDKVLPFREPASLRTLSTDLHESGTSMSMLSQEQWEALRTNIIDGLSRRFRPDQVNIVKATSTTNNLIQPVLDEEPQQKALLLYLPLESYLATMLGKSRQASDLWVQGRKRMRDWLAIDGASHHSLYELAAPQLAAMSWLTSMNLMLAAQAAFGERVLMLDFETLITDPANNLARVTSFFGIDKELETIVEQFPRIASGYSKQPDQTYTPQTRAQLLQRTRTEHAADIRSGIDWARSGIANTPALAPLAEFLP